MKLQKKDVLIFFLFLISLDPALSRSPVKGARPSINTRKFSLDLSSEKNPEEQVSKVFISAFRSLKEQILHLQPVSIIFYIIPPEHSQQEYVEQVEGIIKNLISQWVTHPMQGAIRTKVKEENDGTISSMTITISVFPSKTSYKVTSPNSEMIKVDLSKPNINMMEVLSDVLYIHIQNTSVKDDGDDLNRINLKITLPEGSTSSEIANIIGSVEAVLINMLPQVEFSIKYSPTRNSEGKITDINCVVLLNKPTKNQSNSFNFIIDISKNTQGLRSNIISILGNIREESEVILDSNRPVFLVLKLKTPPRPSKSTVTSTLNKIIKTLKDNILNDIGVTVNIYENSKNEISYLVLETVIEPSDAVKIDLTKPNLDFEKEITEEVAHIENLLIDKKPIDKTTSLTLILKPPKNTNDKSLEEMTQLITSTINKVFPDNEIKIQSKITKNDQDKVAIMTLVITIEPNFSVEPILKQKIIDINLLKPGSNLAEELTKILPNLEDTMEEIGGNPVSLNFLILPPKDSKEDFIKETLKTILITMTEKFPEDRIKSEISTEKDVQGFLKNLKVTITMNPNTCTKKPKTSEIIDINLEEDVNRLLPEIITALPRLNRLLNTNKKVNVQFKIKPPKNTNDDTSKKIIKTCVSILSQRFTNNKLEFQIKKAESLHQDLIVLVTIESKDEIREAPTETIDINLNKPGAKLVTEIVNILPTLKPKILQKLKKGEPSNFNLKIKPPEGVTSDYVKKTANTVLTILSKVYPKEDVKVRAKIVRNKLGKITDITMIISVNPKSKKTEKPIVFPQNPEEVTTIKPENQIDFDLSKPGTNITKETCRRIIRLKHFIDSKRQPGNYISFELNITPPKGTKDENVKDTVQDVLTTLTKLYPGEKIKVNAKTTKNIDQEIKNIIIFFIISPDNFKPETSSPSPNNVYKVNLDLSEPGTDLKKAITEMIEINPGITQKIGGDQPIYIKLEIRPPLNSSDDFVKKTVHDVSTVVNKLIPEDKIEVQVDAKRNYDGTITEITIVLVMDPPTRNTTATTTLSSEPTEEELYTSVPPKHQTTTPKGMTTLKTYIDLTKPNTNLVNEIMKSLPDIKYEVITKQPKGIPVQVEFHIKPQEHPNEPFVMDTVKTVKEILTTFYPNNKITYKVKVAKDDNSTIRDVTVVVLIEPSTATENPFLVNLVTMGTTTMNYGETENPTFGKGETTPSEITHKGVSSTISWAINEENTTPRKEENTRLTENKGVSTAPKEETNGNTEPSREMNTNEETTTSSINEATFSFDLTRPGIKPIDYIEQIIPKLEPDIKSHLDENKPVIFEFKIKPSEKHKPKETSQTLIQIITKYFPNDPVTIKTKIIKTPDNQDEVIYNIVITPKVKNKVTNTPKDKSPSTNHLTEETTRLEKTTQPSRITEETKKEFTTSTVVPTSQNFNRGSTTPAITATTTEKEFEEHFKESTTLKEGSSTPSSEKRFTPSTVEKLLKEMTTQKEETIEQILEPLTPSETSEETEDGKTTFDLTRPGTNAEHEIENIIPKIVPDVKTKLNDNKQVTLDFKIKPDKTKPKQLSETIIHVLHEYFPDNKINVKTKGIKTPDHQDEIIFEVIIEPKKATEITKKPEDLPTSTNPSTEETTKLEKSTQSSTITKETKKQFTTSTVVPTSQNFNRGSTTPAITATTTQKEFEEHFKESTTLKEESSTPSSDKRFTSSTVEKWLKEMTTQKGETIEQILEPVTSSETSEETEDGKTTFDLTRPGTNAEHEIENIIPKIVPDVKTKLNDNKQVTLDFKIKPSDKTKPNELSGTIIHILTEYFPDQKINVKTKSIKTPDQQDEIIFEVIIEPKKTSVITKKPEELPTSTTTPFTSKPVEKKITKPGKDTTQEETKSSTIGTFHKETTASEKGISRTESTPSTKEEFISSNTEKEYISSNTEKILEEITTPKDEHPTEENLDHRTSSESIVEKEKSESTPSYTTDFSEIMGSKKTTEMRKETEEKFPTTSPSLLTSEHKYDKTTMKKEETKNEGITSSKVTKPSTHLFEDDTSEKTEYTPFTEEREETTRKPTEDVTSSELTPVTDETKDAKITLDLTKPGINPTDEVEKIISEKVPQLKQKLDDKKPVILEFKINPSKNTSPKEISENVVQIVTKYFPKNKIEKEIKTVKTPDEGDKIVLVVVINPEKPEEKATISTPSRDTGKPKEIEKTKLKEPTTEENTVTKEFIPSIIGEITTKNYEENTTPDNEPTFSFDLTKPGIKPLDYVEKIIPQLKPDIKPHLEENKPVIFEFKIKPSKETNPKDTSQDLIGILAKYFPDNQVTVKTKLVKTPDNHEEIVYKVVIIPTVPSTHEEEITPTKPANEWKDPQKDTTKPSKISDATLDEKTGTTVVSTSEIISEYSTKPAIDVEETTTAKKLSSPSDENVFNKITTNKEKNEEAFTDLTTSKETMTTTPTSVKTEGTKITLDFRKPGTNPKEEIEKMIPKIVFDVKRKLNDNEPFILEFEITPSDRTKPKEVSEIIMHKLTEQLPDNEIRFKTKTIKTPSNQDRIIFEVIIEPKKTGKTEKPEVLLTSTTTLFTNQPVGQKITKPTEDTTQEETTTSTIGNFYKKTTIPDEEIPTTESTPHTEKDFIKSNTESNGITTPKEKDTTNKPFEHETSSEKEMTSKPQTEEDFFKSKTESNKITTPKEEETTNKPFQHVTSSEKGITYMPHTEEDFFKSKTESNKITTPKEEEITNKPFQHVTSSEKGITSMPHTEEDFFKSKTESNEITTPKEEETTNKPFEHVTSSEKEITSKPTFDETEEKTLTYDLTKTDSTPEDFFEIVPKVIPDVKPYLEEDKPVLLKFKVKPPEGANEKYPTETSETLMKILNEFLPDNKISIHTKTVKTPGDKIEEIIFEISIEPKKLDDQTQPHQVSSSTSKYIPEGRKEVPNIQQTTTKYSSDEFTAPTEDVSRWFTSKITLEKENTKLFTKLTTQTPFEEILSKSTIPTKFTPEKEPSTTSKITEEVTETWIWNEETTSPEVKISSLKPSTVEETFREQTTLRDQTQSVNFEIVTEEETENTTPTSTNITPEEEKTTFPKSNGEVAEISIDLTKPGTDLKEQIDKITPQILEKIVPVLNQKLPITLFFKIKPPSGSNEDQMDESTKTLVYILTSYFPSDEIMVQAIPEKNPQGYITEYVIRIVIVPSTSEKPKDEKVNIDLTKPGTSISKEVTTILPNILPKVTTNLEKNNPVTITFTIETPEKTTENDLKNTVVTLQQIIKDIFPTNEVIVKLNSNKDPQGYINQIIVRIIIIPSISQNPSGDTIDIDLSKRGETLMTQMDKIIPTIVSNVRKPLTNNHTVTIFIKVKPRPGTTESYLPIITNTLASILEQNLPNNKIDIKMNAVKNPSNFLIELTYTITIQPSSKQEEDVDIDLTKPGTTLVDEINIIIPKIVKDVTDVLSENHTLTLTFKIKPPIGSTPEYLQQISPILESILTKYFPTNRVGTKFRASRDPQGHLILVLLEITLEPSTPKILPEEKIDVDLTKPGTNLMDEVNAIIPDSLKQITDTLNSRKPVTVTFKIKPSSDTKESSLQDMAKSVGTIFKQYFPNNKIGVQLNAEKDQQGFITLVTIEITLQPSTTPNIEDSNLDIDLTKPGTTLIDQVKEKMPNILTQTTNTLNQRKPVTLYFKIKPPTGSTESYSQDLANSVVTLLTNYFPNNQIGVKLNAQKDSRGLITLVIIEITLQPSTESPIDDNVDIDLTKPGTTLIDQVKEKMPNILTQTTNTLNQKKPVTLYFKIKPPTGSTESYLHDLANSVVTILTNYFPNNQIGVKLNAQKDSRGLITLVIIEITLQPSTESPIDDNVDIDLTKPGTTLIDQVKEKMPNILTQTTNTLNQRKPVTLYFKIKPPTGSTESYLHDLANSVVTILTNYFPNNQIGVKLNAQKDSRGLITLVIIEITLQPSTESPIDDNVDIDLTKPGTTLIDQVKEKMPNILTQTTNTLNQRKPVTLYFKIKPPTGSTVSYLQELTNSVATILTNYFPNNQIGVKLNAQKDSRGLITLVIIEITLQPSTESPIDDNVDIDLTKPGTTLIDQVKEKMPNILTQTTNTLNQRKPVTLYFKIKPPTGSTESYLHDLANSVVTILTNYFPNNQIGVKLNAQKDSRGQITLVLIEITLQPSSNSIQRDEVVDIDLSNPGETLTNQVSTLMHNILPNITRELSEKRPVTMTLKLRPPPKSTQSYLQVLSQDLKSLLAMYIPRSQISVNITATKNPDNFLNSIAIYITILPPETNTLKGDKLIDLTEEGVDFIKEVTQYLTIISPEVKSKLDKGKPVNITIAVKPPLESKDEYIQIVINSLVPVLSKFLPKHKINLEANADKDARGYISEILLVIDVEPAPKPSSYSIDINLEDSKLKLVEQVDKKLPQVLNNLKEDLKSEESVTLSFNVVPPAGNRQEYIQYLTESLASILSKYFPSNKMSLKTSSRENSNGFLTKIIVEITMETQVQMKRVDIDLSMPGSSLEKEISGILPTILPSLKGDLSSNKPVTLKFNIRPPANSNKFFLNQIVNQLVVILPKYFPYNRMNVKTSSDENSMGSISDITVLIFIEP